MNPALQNYLQNTQNQQATSQQSQPYNPFDSGIQKAIASARQSLGMTKDQEENAFNRGLLAFGDAIAGSPREKGFLNNLTSAGRALSPGIRAYDEAEAGSLAENQALANEILKQDALEKQRQIEAEDRAWRRQLSERQLGEQSRAHDLMYGAMSQRKSQSGITKKEEEAEASNSELSNLLNNAEELLTKDLEKQETYRGRTSNLLSRFTPGGYIPSKEQAQINALGDVLRGKLFNTWGYRNQAEFEHVPSISADNPPEVNLEIIRTLKNLLGNQPLEDQGNLQGNIALEGDYVNASNPMSLDNNGGTVLMQNQAGQRFYIPSDQVEAAINDPDEPLIAVEE